MKTVAAGAHYTTITVDTEEEVKFSFASTSLSVEASGGDITVALTDTAQAGDDETITVPDGESRMFIHHRMNIDTYYLTGSGTAKLYASNMSDVNPFKGKSKGGDGGGDTTHYKGTTTTPLENGSTTNPITIDGESYTAVFGDVVVYGYTEFVFDGTQWSEFGRPFDTTPIQDSTNAVTSGGVYAIIHKVNPSVGVSNIILGTSSTAGGGTSSVVGGYSNSVTGTSSACFGEGNSVTGSRSFAAGQGIHVSQPNLTAFGKYNLANTGDLFNIGNGTSTLVRSNIVEVNSTSANVNGDIKINNVAIPTPYTTMPTITESMLGQIAMYVGATGGGFTQGCFYVASTDGAAEPTYSWVQIGGGTLGLEEVVLWESEGTTNPDTITLSEAYTNFDEIVVYNGGDGKGISTNIYIQSVLSQNAIIGIIEDINRRIWYQFASSTTLNKIEEDKDKAVVLQFIVGRRYTRVSPTGYRRVTLWENEGTTNPDTITLSEAWSNFDELVIVTVTAGSVTSQYETTKHTSIMAIGGTYTMWYNSENTWGSYSTTSSTVLTKSGSGGDYHIAKIIGIKY